ncbi:hypothetical protein BDY24DRAFT_440300 [Mrakia frigida]|uniref:BNR repeat-containing protein n=1 Tax=Mrakia frigida TaxID=29902 RepID=UPI003FCC1B6D
MSLKVVFSSTLGARTQAVNNLNGGSFQQDALCTRKGWQYVAFYRDAPTVVAVRHVCLGRRNLALPLQENSWETIEFKDYDQKEDDGHNIISLGICSTDGSIHFSFDNHDTPLVYRRSLGDLTTNPEGASWSTSSFSAVLNVLPGLEEIERSTFENITYPRFLSLPSGSLLLEYRVGISGLGNGLIFVYSKDEGGKCSWKTRGVYLQGVENNAYINGIDVSLKGNLHVSWTYRDYVPVSLEESRQQAGPNGPENNHDLLYASTSIPPDLNPTSFPLQWISCDGTALPEGPILPSMEGILAFEIPKGSGILNQEAQTLDSLGGFHVLNREFNKTTGAQTWMHYHLPPASLTSLPRTKGWSRTPLPEAYLPPSLTSSRGKIVEVALDQNESVLLFLLPMEEDLIVLRKSESASGFEEVLRLKGAGGRENEVLFDRSRLDENGVLSLFFGGFAEGYEEGAGGEKRRRGVVKVVDMEWVA